MNQSLIGQIVRHDGKIFQILSENKSIITAHSYDESCGIDTTIIVSKEKGNVIATKSKSRRNRKIYKGN